jgi:hypothetical protein
MDVVEKLRGRGRVLDGTEVLATEVPYQLTVWTDAGQTGSNGRLDISFHAAIALMDRAHALLLEVEDGRLFRFRMTSTSGRISGAEG